MQYLQLKSLLIKGFYCAFDGHQQGLAAAVECFVRGDFNPAFTDAVFFHVIALFAIDANAHIELKYFGHMVWTAWVDRKAIRQSGWYFGIGHNLHLG